jgi:hypothetical protein
MRRASVVLLILSLALIYSQAAVTEASNSQDVDSFINSDQNKNIAILFYDRLQNFGDKTIHKNTDKIISVFLNKGDKDRLKEDWIDKLSQEFNLIKVDKNDHANQKIVSSFNVKSTPLVVIFNNKKTELETIVDDTTFDKVKSLLLKVSGVSDPAAGQIRKSSVHSYPVYYGPQPTAKKSSEEQAYDDALQKLQDAQQINISAQQEVRIANERLERSKKDMVEYARVNEAQNKAKKSREETEKALKVYNEAKKKLDDKIASMKNGIDGVEQSVRKVQAPAPVVRQLLNPEAYYPYQYPSHYQSHYSPHYVYEGQQVYSQRRGY